MLLLQASGFLNFEYELHFRKNTYDENGNIVEYDIDQTDGDFFEVTLRNGNSKVLSILFDLDGFFVSLELREEGRKNSIMLMKRNYNGVFYIFPRNCLNLKKETIDYYLDYYNNNIIIDNQYAKQLISEIHNIISGIVTSVGNSKHSKMLKTISESNFDDLFDNDYFRRQGYLSPISVLPPNIRPDNNHHYTIIQVASGCKIMAQRKKACGFCTSFHLKYYERNISELKYHISCLINCNPITTKRANCAFLSDGDPLIIENILQLMDTIKEALPNIREFESFISTKTILNIDGEKWSNLLKSGLKKVYWGVESADEVTLNIIDKPHSVDMLKKAREILEKNGIPYDIIIMCGIGGISQANRTCDELINNHHVTKTVDFVNSSRCNSVFISKIQISPECSMGRMVGKTVFPFSEDEMELQYRTLIKRIDKNIRGSYGNQFVVERVNRHEI